MGQENTPVIQEQIARITASFKDVGNIAELEKVAEKHGQSLLVLGAGPLPIVRTEYTHDIILTLTPERLDAQLEHAIALERTFIISGDVEDAESMIWNLPRPLRYNALKLAVNLRQMRSMPFSSEFAKLALSTYTDAELFCEDDTRVWRELLLQGRESLRDLTLDHLDDALPAGSTPDTEITLYHGIEYQQEENYQANAWTLSPRVARFFSSRITELEYGEERGIYQSTMKVRDLQERMSFYTNNRNEQEIYLHNPIEREYIS